MKKMSRRQIVPSLVKETESISEHPGYRYKYFGSFEELNQYFTELCGADWRTQEWALFWLRDYWRTQKEAERARQRQPQVVKARVVKPDQRPPDHVILALIDHYRDEGYSRRKIFHMLREIDGIQTAPKTLIKIMERHNRES